MRRQLVVGAAAVTATIIIAFVVPLGIAVRVLANNRPLAIAEQTARSVATVVALTDDRDVIAQTVAAAQSSDAAVTVFLRDGATLGPTSRRSEAVDEAFRGAAFATSSGDGTSVYVPAIRADGAVAVVQAAVSAQVLEQGVAQSWLLLGALAVALLVVAVAIADWLGRSVVRPARAVAGTARRLAAGDLKARTQPDGPPEVADVARALNGLAEQITALLAAERALVADLSHRLRTPLTALRIDAEGLRHEQDRERLRADVDAVEATVTELIREARRPVAGTDDAQVDLVAVVRDRASYWGALADEQQRPWRLEITADEVVVPADRTSLEALVDVLLDNVFTHTPEGTGYTVSVSPHALVVSDDGLDADQPGAVRGASGGRSTGLGLDIARQTARRLGGELRVTPGEARGTRVEVALPARRRSRR